MPAQSKILIFCGKGGVGKTTLSFALALKKAESGQKVVVVTSHPLNELAVALSLDGIAAQFPNAAKNLFVVHIDAKELLAEVVRENFPSQWVADAVLKSKIYSNLIEVAPGLKEFQFLARLQQLADRTGGGVTDYDLLLWDAPASGHFLGTLHAARNFETFLSGPLAAAGADLARFFSSMSRITLLPVTTLEEMAIEETREMCERLATEFSLQAHAVLINLVSPLLQVSDADIQSLAAEEDAALRFSAGRAKVERERSAELKREIPAPQIPVERVRSWSNDLDLLAQLGRSLEGIDV